MSTDSNSSALAIGIDAAESSLVRRMIEQNELPALRSLLAEGKWLEVRSPAPVGSGTVWPTFLTGEEPAAHGIYSEWKWLPKTMSLRRYEGHHLTPFWKSLADDGVSVGVFDVPFAPTVGIKRGFEVCEWWAHDSTEAGLRIGPDEIQPLVQAAPAHPLSSNRFVTATPDSKNNSEELAEACSTGARARGSLAQRLIRETKPRLSVIVFPEVHHAGHQLWHTIASDHPIYQGLECNGAPVLKEVHRAVDEQIGEIIASSNADTVLVFALHGMRPAHGFPAFLGPLLCEQGFSRLARWRSQSWTRRGLSAFAAVKRHAPAPLKKLYYQVTPSTATYKLARPTMMPAYDWQKTRAFSLPTDQYGWIRINLRGREAEGTVSPGEYDAVCAELTEMLSTLAAEDGELLVEDVMRTAADPDSALVNPLPDLVVHWRYAALAVSLKIRDSKVPAERVGKKSTGQHASPGFCIYRGNVDAGLNGVVAGKDLWRLITAGLR
ncbi:MAG TPA: alkaline phosphatase family protein [Pyrinomonadaceae bacterium]|nr:alkaline phosphatase family protein [Pyrinomonadaceae bacterium]